MAAKAHSKKLGKGKSLKDVKPLTTATGATVLGSGGKHFPTATLHVK